MLSCMSCLYILYVNPLSVSFVNIFYHSVGYLFILSMVFFAVPKLLSLIRSHLFIFAILSFTLEDRSKNITMIFFFFNFHWGGGPITDENTQPTKNRRQIPVIRLWPLVSAAACAPQPPLFVRAAYYHDFYQRMSCLCFPLGVLWFQVIHLGL